MCALQKRCEGQPSAIGLERNQGPLVFALRTDHFLGLFPVNPLTLARYRAALTPSRAKEDPTDADLPLEWLRTHRDTLPPLNPQSPPCVPWHHSSNTAGAWWETTCGSPLVSRAP